MTKIELFQKAISMINTSNGNLAEVKEVVEVIEGLNHEIELLQRKASTPRKPTATQIENDKFREAIADFLYKVNTPQTVKEIVANVEGLADLSNQRVTHLLTALRKAGAIKRTVIKKVPYYEYGVEEGYANTKEEG